MGGILGDNLVARVFASQKLPRDSGETIFAARQQSVSQGPLSESAVKIAIERDFGALRCGLRVHA